MKTTLEKLTKEMAAQNRLTALAIVCNHFTKFDIITPNFKKEIKDKVEEVLDWCYSPSKSSSISSKDS